MGSFEDLCFASWDLHEAVGLPKLSQPFVAQFVALSRRVTSVFFFCFFECAGVLLLINVIFHDILKLSTFHCLNILNPYLSVVAQIQVMTTPMMPSRWCWTWQTAA